MRELLIKLFFPAYASKTFGPVRYAFPLILITALFASLASVVSENSSYVVIRTDTVNVARDQQFSVDVLISAHVPVNAVDIVLSYPKERIRIDSIDTGTSVITLWAEEPRAQNGNIYLRGGTFRKGFIGEHTIARVRATAIEAGEARIFAKDTQLVAGDGKGTSVEVASAENTEARIQVSGADGVVTGEAAIDIATDTDGDGDVDISDVSAFMVAWFTKGSIYDFNGDGRMTFRDFSILLADSFFR